MGKDTEFLEAARSGNITLVEKILNQRAKRSLPLASLRRGPGANIQDNNGYTALHHATLNGHLDVIKLLLAHDASPNLTDARRASPLHLAAWAGHQEIVKLFLTHPNRQANPNLQTDDDETPLHFAAQHGHTGALTVLLAHGADPNLTNNRNETPLDLAAQYGRLQAVQVLIRAHPELLNPFKIDSRVGSANGGDGNNSGPKNSSSVRSCPHRGIILSHSPLHLASRNGHQEVVEVLLRAGVNVNLLTTSGTALHEAALCGKDNIVRTLLDYGADLDATDYENRTALDILEEFPPNVTKGIVSVINNHRNSMQYDSESDDIRGYTSSGQHHRQSQRNFPNYQRKPYHSNRNALGSSYENSHSSPIHNCYSNSSHLDMTTSPSSSMGSIGPPSPHPRVADCYLPKESNKKPKSTAPKKPPRRNLSISPTHLYSGGGSSGSSSFMTMSVDGYTPMGNRSAGSSSDTSSKQYPQTNPDKYEYICLAHSGSKKIYDSDSQSRQVHQQLQQQQPQSNNSDYVPMMPKPEPRNILQHSYENTTLKSYNPNRKLRRNRDNYYEKFSLEFTKIRDDGKSYLNFSPSTNTALGSDGIDPTIVPQSPTHYQQPPTPEHPPPSAVQAENCIHECIRPLSQEYKRRSDIIQDQVKYQTNSTIESGTSPPEPLCSSLCASSGSLSSSISISDRSLSTDCVEEFIGDVPFAGLFKGSTMTLNNVSSNYPLQLYRYQQGGDYSNSNNSSGGGAGDGGNNDSDNGGFFITTQNYSQERPRKLNPQQQIRFSNDPRIEYQQNHSLSFGGIITCSSNSMDYDTNYGESLHQSLSINDCDQSEDDLLRHHHHQDNVTTETTVKDRSKVSSIGVKQQDVLSPFDEEEAWAKISEIMESFGSGILSTQSKKRNDCDGGDDDDSDNETHKNLLDNNAIVEQDHISTLEVCSHNSNIEPKHGQYISVGQFLVAYQLQHLEKLLIENGFDHVDHLNGILDETDLQSMNVPLKPEGVKLLESICKLPLTSSQLFSQQNHHKQNSNNNNSILNVDQWLQNIHLSEYADIFKRHLCTNLDSGVCRVWEAELQTVLEIQKIGHRKRILHSISTNRSTTSNRTTINELNADLNTLDGDIISIKDDIDEKPLYRAKDISRHEGSALVLNTKHNKKNRPAPKPPIRATSLEIRAPSELLLGLPSNLRTQWRHPANILVTSAVTYDINYLGSTVVKELRGTESTRKSIQKLKCDNQTNHSLNSNHNNVQFMPGNSMSQQQQQQQQQKQKQFYRKQLVRLSISHRGVEFINTESETTICEHEIRNINCACQDADDLSHFAYITKDSDNNIHYCHVFNADSMDLATEIILTLGQAFEVAYQLALRDSSAKKFNRSAMLDRK